MGGIESAGEKTSANCRTAFISPGERHVGKVEDKAEGGVQGMDGYTADRFNGEGEETRCGVREWRDNGDDSDGERSLKMDSCFFQSCL